MAIPWESNDEDAQGHEGSYKSRFSRERKDRRDNLGDAVTREKYMQVLVAEQDRDLGIRLRETLQNGGHAVDLTFDADCIVEHVRSKYPDLLVLDSEAHETGAHPILKQIRAEGCDAAALVLTAWVDPIKRAEILDAGADDCLLKPFSLIEFAARCRALLRRRAQGHSPVLRHGDLEVHRLHRQVFRAGREIVLTPKEFALLEYLMLRRGENVSRRELLEEVWKMELDTGSGIVDVFVRYLRLKLEPAHSPAESWLIQAVRGTGYRIGGPPGKSNRPLRPRLLGAAQRDPAEMDSASNEA